jgi:uncharacterized caspase-like protein
MEAGRNALIVASYEYQDPGLRRLRSPARDAEALAEVLRDPWIGHFSVLTILNEPAYKVNEAIEDFFSDRAPDDFLLLYLSCHGVKDEAGDLYFAMTDTKLGRLAATGVAADFVNRRMNRSRSRSIALLLDCCYAGAFDRGMLPRAAANIGVEGFLAGRGRAVITSSSAMEYAFEELQLVDAGDDRPSVFTSAVVEGLATGNADIDQDGLIALDELYEFVYQKVRQATPNQTPGKWTFGGQGDLYIAWRKRPVALPAPLPRELEQMLESPLAGARQGVIYVTVQVGGAGKRRAVSSSSIRR